ncbi:MAG: hypothetical protein M3R00_02940 [Pseudomonadota bacterium]|nr:hypothetical protein [Pseudomonadota bacterium]
MERDSTIHNSTGVIARYIYRMSDFIFRSSILELLNTVIVRFFVLGLNFATTALITRNLSVADRGKYGYLLNLIYLLMTFLCFGFHSSTVYMVAKKKFYFAYLYTITCLISFAAFILLTVFAASGLLQFLCPVLDTQDVVLLIFGAPLVLSCYFSSYFFLSINDFKRYNFFEFSKSLIFFLITIITLDLVLSYQYYLSFFIISNFLYLVVAFYVFLKLGYIKISMSRLFRDWKRIAAVFKKSVNMASISYISCVLAFLLSKYILFFIGAFLKMGIYEREALGYYSVALANIDMSIVLPSTLAFYIFPKISAVQQLKDKIAIVNRMILLCIIYFAVIAIVSYFFLDDIFIILYGPKYLASVSMFEALIPSAVFISIISCISSFIRGMGMEKTAIYAPLWGLIFLIGGSIALMRSQFNAYHFIYLQNISNFVCIAIYATFFYKKWLTSKRILVTTIDRTVIKEQQ